jgi:DHA2 family multidrug resistance protein-like MFS transporter
VRESPTPPPAGIERTRNPWWALAALCLPVLIISMDNTVLAFAVPQLSEALEPTSSQLLWIVDAYSFVLAGLLVTMGNLGDRIGRRKLLLWGSAGFALASLLAAFASTAPMLIGARALLGVAGATLLPSTLSIIRNVFTEDRQRQLAIAVWTTMFAIGGALGPIVGGFLLEHYWYGSVFLLGVPVPLALLVVGPAVLPESRDPDPGRFDLSSSLLSFAAIVPVVYGVKLVAEHGPGPDSAVAVVVGVACGIAFVRRQRRLADPMIDIDLFRLPRFRVAVSATVVGCFSYAGSMFMLTQFLQLVALESPSSSALLMLPAVLTAVVCTMSAPAIARRIGAFTLITVGLVLTALGFVCLLTLSADGAVGIVVVSLMVLNAGFGFVNALAIDAVLSSVPPERAGAGAAVSETCNELGIALGTAILGSVVTFVYRRDLDALHDTTDLPADAVDHALETLGAAARSAEDLGGAAGAALRTAANQAFVAGIHAAAVVAALVAFVVAASSWRARSRTGDVAIAGHAIADDTADHTADDTGQGADNP